MDFRKKIHWKNTTYKKVTIILRRKLKISFVNRAPDVYHQGEERISNIMSWCQEGHPVHRNKQNYHLTRCCLTSRKHSTLPQCDKVGVSCGLRSCGIKRLWWMMMILIAIILTQAAQVIFFPEASPHESSHHP